MAKGHYGNLTIANVATALCYNDENLELQRSREFAGEMSQSLQDVLKVARSLPPEERRQLIDLLIGELKLSTVPEPSEAHKQQARAVVEETFGSIKGLDQETLKSLAEDEEYSGY